MSDPINWADFLG